MSYQIKIKDNNIKIKGNNTDLQDILDAINSLPPAGEDTSDATITSGSQMLDGVVAYGTQGKIIGTIPSQSATTVVPNGSEQIAIQEGTYAAGAVTVSAVPTETKNITANGTYTPENGKYFSSVSVNIVGESFDTQTKSISPTESVQTVTPDNGYDGLSSVTIEAIPTNYVGSSINREGAKSITPTKSAQTVIQAGSYAEGAVTVEAIPSEYVTTTDATAISADIMSGKTAYVNGVKVEGTHVCSGSADTSDATATEYDIAKGKTAYIAGGKVTGAMTVNSYYIGNGAPLDSFGIDGDLFFVRGGD